MSSKTIGIVGLFVGQSVSIALSIERISGNLLIADFDTLELSNLNRIRTSVRNLGLPKTIVTAREITEIDPYLSISVYGEGITTENIDEFVSNTDLIIEECDSIDIKILIRKIAKKHKKPVLMDTSDRGMIDIERYDIDSNYPIFHNMLESLPIHDLNWIKSNKLKTAKAILNFENLSSEMKKAIPEIGKTINSWPQLGSHVLYGGGITADLSRKILLKKNIKSGRYYFDIDAIVSQ